MSPGDLELVTPSGLRFPLRKGSGMGSMVPEEGRRPSLSFCYCWSPPSVFQLVVSASRERQQLFVSGLFI